MESQKHAQINEIEKRGYCYKSQEASSVVCLKDKHDVCILTNIHPPPVDGNFQEESDHAFKPQVIEDYNAHMGFVDKSDRMVNSYGKPGGHGNEQRNCFSTLNAYLLYKSCGGKMTHKKFHEILVQDLIVQMHEAKITVSGISRGRPSWSGAQLSRLEVKHLQHWPSKGKQRCGFAK
jgi:hypothetical protein